MMEVFKEFRPLLRDLGSARRSPTAGSSDIGRANPIDRVSDTAPQGPVVAPQSPDVAPGPSLASFDPHASVLAVMMTFAMTSSLLRVVDWTRESMCLLGFAMYRHQLPLRTKTVSGTNWRVFTLKFPTSGKSTTSVAPVVGHLQINLRMIWRFFSPSMPSLA